MCHQANSYKHVGITICSLKDLDVIAFDWLIVYCVFLCNNEKKRPIELCLPYTGSTIHNTPDICADLMVNHLFVLHSIKFN